MKNSPLKRKLSKLLPFKSKKGFSLIECVMAIALFSVLASIALQILANSIERKKENQELVENQNAQMKLIANGDIRRVGTKKGEKPDFKLESVSHPGIVVGAEYVSYSSSGSYVISKPDYDLTDLEKTLLNTNFSNMYNADVNGAKHPNNKVFSNATLGEVTVKNIENTTLSTPVNVGGVEYSQLQTYQITFTLAAEPPPNLTTFLIPENCYLASVKAYNARASLLNESNVGTYSNIVRINRMKGSVKITLTFYLNSSDFKYIGYLGGTGDEVILADDGNNIYKKV